MGYYLLVHTQDVENYGAHAWDGEGQCPQYWKYKHGTSLAILLKDEDLTLRDANYAARCIEELDKLEWLVNNDYFKTYYIGHEIVVTEDMFIQLHDEEPDLSEYEFYGLVHFPHIHPEVVNNTRFCWIKRRRSTHPEWRL